MILVEYECPHCGRFEYLEQYEPHDERDCTTCGTLSPFVISAAAIKPSYASATQGKGSSERPPGFVSTEALADGMKQSEYRAKLAERRKEKIRAHVRSKL